MNGHVKNIKAGKFDLTRVGRIITQNMEGGVVTHTYPTVKAAKFALEQARISKNLILPESSK